MPPKYTIKQLGLHGHAKNHNCQLFTSILHWSFDILTYDVDCNFQWCVPYSFYKHPNLNNLSKGKIIMGVSKKTKKHSYTNERKRVSCNWVFWRLYNCFTFNCNPALVFNELCSPLNNKTWYFVIRHHCVDRKEALLHHL